MTTSTSNLESSKRKGTELREGYRLEGGSRRRIIPRFDNDEFRTLREEFEDQYDLGEDSDKQIAEKVNEFVRREFEYNWDPDHESISFDPETGEELQEGVPLELVIMEREGVCKDFAATAQMMMQSYGVDSEYKKGGFPKQDGEDTEREKHAWLKVSVDDGEYFVDPTNGYFGEYQWFAEEFRDVGIVETSQEILEPE